MCSSDLLDDLDVFELSVAHGLRDEFGGASNVSLMFGRGGDAGDAQELLELLQQAVFIGFDERLSRKRHIPL